MYEFLYHASSRVVHFSVPELMRRIWGRRAKYNCFQLVRENTGPISLCTGVAGYSSVFLITIPALNRTNRDFEDSESAPI